MTLPANRSLEGLLGPRVVGNSSDELARAALRIVLSNGYSRQAPGGTQLVREVMHWQMALTDPRRRLVRSAASSGFFNPGEAVARFFATIAGSDRLEQIRFYLPAAHRFSPDGIALSGHAHGARIFMRIGGSSQFEQAARIIRSSGDGNRALITLHHPTDIGTGPVDLPCPTDMFFFRRGDTLHASVKMRANDALRLFVYDLFEFSMLHEFMAVCTGLELGNFFYGGYALHVIGEDRLSAAATIAAEQEEPAPAMAPMPACGQEFRSQLADEEALLRYAASTREPKRVGEALQAIDGRMPSYWADLLCALALQAASTHFEPRALEDLVAQARQAQQADRRIVTALTIDYLVRLGRCGGGAARD